MTELLVKMQGVGNILLEPAIKIQRKYPANLIGADIDDFNEEYSYDTYDSYLKLVKNARVSSDSIVYRNGFLINETLYSNKNKSYYQLRHLFKNILTSNKISLDHKKKYLLVTDTESVGHFHWFTEVVPKLLCIKSRASEFTLLLPDKPYIKQIAIDSLKLLKLDFDDLILMKEKEFYKIKNLYYVSGISRTGQMHDELMKQMRGEFVSGKAGGDRRIYVSRENAKFRKILNEKELFAVLKNYGFETIHGENLSLADQIKIFSDSETLLGIHGAGLTNCIFMNRGSNVVELRRKETALNNGYWHLADSLDHKYYYYNGIADSEKSIIGNGCNLTIPTGDFEEKILRNL